MPARPLRPYVYAVLDVVFALVYFLIATRLTTSSTGQFQAASYVLCAAVLCAAAGTALRNRIGWWMAVAGCTLVALGAVTLLVLLTAAAAYMHGIYGSIGRAAGTVTLAIAAVSITVYLLLPAFQLGYLLSADGRRAAGRPA